MKCNSCGANNPEGARFCTSCGAMLEPPASPTNCTPAPVPVPSDPLETPTAQARNNLPAIAVVAAVAIATVVALVLAIRGTPADAGASGAADVGDTASLSGRVDTQGGEDSAEAAAAPETPDAADASGSADGQDAKEEPQTDARKDAATHFIEVWYDDWTFADGHEVPNTVPAIERCAPLIAEGSGLLADLGDADYSMSGQFYRGAAASVVSIPQAEDLGNGVYRVTVRYVLTQNSVDQNMYDDMLRNPYEDVWDVGMDNDNKVVSLVRAAGSQEAPAAGTTYTQGQTASGTYILSGWVHTHQETMYDQVIFVVSMILDSPVDYAWEYKGTVSDRASEVELETSNSDTYGQWAAYDGLHITVECDGLHGAIHDASTHGVDTLATGTIRLLDAG